MTMRISWPIVIPFRFPANLDSARLPLGPVNERPVVTNVDFGGIDLGSTKARAISYGFQAKGLTIGKHRFSGMKKSSSTRLLAGLIAVIIAGQLLSTGLQHLRRPAPPTMFSGAGSLDDTRAPSLGPRDADIVILLFSDYACPLCRAMHPDLRQVVASDGHIRVVYRDWPILGPRSIRASRLAIASVSQGRHAAFDDALMRHGGPLDEASLRAAATRAGVDWMQLERDAASDATTIDQLLAETDRTARGVGFSGTPTMIIGSYLVAGRVSAHRMAELVALYRDRR